MTSWTARAILPLAIGFGMVLLSSGCGGDIRLTTADAGMTGAPTTSGCKGDPDCATGRCDVPSGACVECIADEQCTGVLRRCDASLHRCVECGVAADCPSGSTCELITRRCLPSCRPPLSCPASAPTCDESRGVCLPCTLSASCTEGKRRVCDVAGGRCVECLVDPDCSEREERRRCDSVAGRCTACLTSADCSHNLEHPVCDLTEGECKERSDR